MMVLEKRSCLSAKISHTVSCNISLYRDTKEVIYRYTQNVYRCISTMIIIVMILNYCKILYIMQKVFLTILILWQVFS